MGYLTGNGFAFDLDMTGRKKKKRRRGRPSRPSWKVHGEGAAWRAISTENEPVLLRFVSTGSKYPNNPYSLHSY
jgi:hypothetical protein